MWSFFYYVVALTIPHAFNWPKGLDTGDWQAVQQVLTYFSFTTLTTTGFGDVTPAIPLTRTLAMFEGLGGAALPGHHLDPVGVSISGLSQTVPINQIEGIRQLPLGLQTQTYEARDFHFQERPDRGTSLAS